MKHLKRFNEDIETNYNRLYDKWKYFIESIIEVFVEFEDNGWYWSTGSENSRNKWISLDWWPEFHCVMLKGEEDYTSSEKNYTFDYTGSFRNGKITWETKDFKHDQKNEEVNRVLEELEDFIVAIKRLNDIDGVVSSFSYNNKGGESKIILRGFVKVKFN
jgi:hypothetical protein